MLITPGSLSSDHTASFLFFFVLQIFRPRLSVKRQCDVSPAVEKTSLKFSLLYSLWHKQTSTYALPDIDVPDILKRFDWRIITATDFCLKGLRQDYTNFQPCLRTVRCGIYLNFRFIVWKTVSLSMEAGLFLNNCFKKNTDRRTSPLRSIFVGFMLPWK